MGRNPGEISQEGYYSSDYNCIETQSEIPTPFNLQKEEFPSLEKRGWGRF
jgi:hypothetical protein